MVTTGRRSPFAIIGRRAAVDLRRFFERAIRASFDDLALQRDPAVPYLADLLTRFARTENLYPRGTTLPRLETVVDMLLEAGTAWDGSYFQPEHRSEERRVGKECRSRWWPDE